MPDQKNRINSAISYLKGIRAAKTQKEIAAAMNIDPASLSQAVNGKRNYLTDSFLRKFVAVYPIFSLEWLVNGTGDMLRADGARSVKQDADPAMKLSTYEGRSLAIVYVPIVNITAWKSYLERFDDAQFIDSLPSIPVIPDTFISGHYRCFEIEGDSMDDGSRNALYNRDIVLSRSVERDMWRYSFIYENKTCIIISSKGVVARRIQGYDATGNSIVCRCLNPLYEDVAFPLSEVQELYIINKIIDRSLHY